MEKRAHRNQNVGHRIPWEPFFAPRKSTSRRRSSRDGKINEIDRQAALRHLAPTPLAVGGLTVESILKQHEAEEMVVECDRLTDHDKKATSPRGVLDFDSLENFEASTQQSPISVQRSNLATPRTPERVDRIVAQSWRHESDRRAKARRQDRKRKHEINLLMEDLTSSLRRLESKVCDAEGHLKKMPKILQR